MEDVRDAMLGTGFPDERMHLMKGKVEDTIPKYAPNSIALLRLDTDFYESTKHELTNLYPKLATGAVLIVDDYGTWAGSQRVVKEYFHSHGIKILFNRLDAGGRIAIKS